MNKIHSKEREGKLIVEKGPNIENTAVKIIP